MSEGGRESLPGVREWSGDTAGCLRVVGRLYWMSGSGGEALSDVQEWSDSTTGCLQVVERLPKYPGVVRRPSRMSRSGRRPS